MSTQSKASVRDQAVRLLIGLVALLLVGPAWAQPAPLAGREVARPKYGPQATRLHQSQEYVRREPAPDFWGLVPYYIAQPDDASCALTSVTMVVNALRARRPLDAHQPLATPEAIREQHAAWDERLPDAADGVTLDQLAGMLPPVLQAYGLVDGRVEVCRFRDTSAGELDRLRDILQRNEQSAEDMVIVNVLQSTLTGDPEGAVGHMAPLGAFDVSGDRVLLFDPDRRWYEPYWVSTGTLLQAMTTRDPVSGQSRGLLRVSAIASAARQPRTSSPP